MVDCSLVQMINSQLIWHEIIPLINLENKKPNLVFYFKEKAKLGDDKNTDLSDSQITG